MSLLMIINKKLYTCLSQYLVRIQTQCLLTESAVVSVVDSCIYELFIRFILNIYPG